MRDEKHLLSLQSKSELDCPLHLLPPVVMSSGGDAHTVISEEANPIIGDVTSHAGSTPGGEGGGGGVACRLSGQACNT